MAKRPDGALEHDIMIVLWAAGSPLPPGVIKDRLGTDLAYTSVATVLGRLHAKGLVTRAPAGRAFTYEAALAEPDLAAQRINTILSSTNDPKAVLARFVGGLSKSDAKAMRSLLDKNGR